MKKLMFLETVLRRRGGGSTAPPDAPTGLSATVISTSRIDLAWTDAATTETEYRVYRSTDGVSYSLLTTLAANSNSHSDTTITAGTTYYYKVGSYNAGGESLSSVVSANTLTLGLFAFWDSEDLTTLFQDSAGSTPVTTSGQPVGMWQDRSGNARHFLQTGAGTLKTTYQGAGGGLSSDGGDTLKVTGLSAAFTAETVTIIFNPTATTSFSRVFTQWTTTADYNETGHYLPVLRNATNLEFASYAGSAARSSVSVSNNQKNLFISRHTGSAITNRVGGVDGSSYSHTLNKTFNGMAIFADDLGTSNLTGRIYQIVVHNRAITNDEVTALETLYNSTGFIDFLP